MAQIDFDMHGFEHAKLALDRLPHDARDELQRIINSSTAFSEVTMKAFAPGSIKQLTGRDRTSFIDHVTLQGIAGIRPGHKPGSPPWYPVFPEKGTGIYNLDRPSFIRAKKPGGVLTFQKQGEPRKFKRWVRGQRPQHYVYFAYQMTRMYVSTRIRTFRLRRR